MSQYDNSSVNSNQGTIDSLAKLYATPSGEHDRWQDEITAAEKEQEKFVQQGRRVVRRYLDDRDAVETNNKWFNIFYTNVGILEASLYANIPKADVSRKFTDMNDDVARVAGNILQRCIQQDMNEPNCDFDQVMRQAVSDRLIPGLGTAWLRLVVETEPIESQPTAEPSGEITQQPEPVEPAEQLERISHQEVAIDYVYWEDILWSPCRVWSERRWIARKVLMDKDALVKRFGKELADQIPLNAGPKKLPADQNTPTNMVLKRAEIYEIWDKMKREVIWFSKGVEKLLDKRSDPLGLCDFEPCPKPLMANTTTSNCRPKPDFAMLQDQYNELDETNNRISLLIIACKVVGVYDQSSDGIQRMLTEGYDNILIPVDNWAMFAEKGGIKGSVDWLPLDMVVAALQQLSVHRETIKGQIYELTGINDVVRGNTKASETLGAQELKSKFASVRIQRLQDEVTRFAEQILQIKAELIIKHFDSQIIAKMANCANMVPEDQQLVVQALQLLKGDGEEMEWRVTIQSDAMAIIDYATQKQERTEFLNAVATFLQSSSTVGQGAPQLIPLMLQLLKFGVAGFRVSKDVEGIFDKYISDFEQEIEQQKNAPPQPDPEQQKMQAEQQMKEREAAMKEQAAQADQQRKAQESQQQMAMHQAEFQQELQQQRDLFQQEMRQMMLEFTAKIQMKREENAANIEAKKQQAAIGGQNG
jgi:hypothetical protein